MVRILRNLYSFHEFTSTVFHMSLDFQAWNNYFREENVDTVGRKLLDPWFGTNTMKFYQSTFFTAPLNFASQKDDQKKFTPELGEKNALQLENVASDSRFFFEIVQ